MNFLAIQKAGLLRSSKKDKILLGKGRDISRIWYAFDKGRVDISTNKASASHCITNFCAVSDEIIMLRSIIPKNYLNISLVVSRDKHFKKNNKKNRC